MAAFNKFFVIGMIETRPRKRFDKEHNVITSFVLKTRSGDEHTNTYVPIICKGNDIVDTYTCRIGNIVAVKGEIASSLYFNKKTNVNHIFIMFSGKEIDLIKPTKIKKVDEGQFRDIVELMSLENYES